MSPAGKKVVMPPPCYVCESPECIGYDYCPICHTEYEHAHRRRMQELALERARDMRRRGIKTWYAMDRNK